MYLTTNNAAEYLGKKLNSSKSKKHYYPIIVRQWDNGEYYYRDSNFVCMKVPDPKDLFNSVHFDTVEEVKD